MTDYLLFVVSGFIFIVVALLTILSHVGRSNTKTTGDHDRQSFRQWTSWDFDTWQGQLSGRQAALQILLPIGRGVRHDRFWNCVPYSRTGRHLNDKWIIR